MRPWLALVLLFATPADAGDLQTLAAWMTGSFSSAAQAEAEEGYFDIRLEMVPIWEERDDGVWLYVEQAAANTLDRPYRQRVYRLTAEADGRFRSEVFSIPEPLRFAGDWRFGDPLAELAPDDLEPRQGCAVVLGRVDEAAFAGATEGTGCSSTLRGAAHATSEVRVAADGIDSWDRGFDAAGEQVWGAEHGPYLFRRSETAPLTHEALWLMDRVGAPVPSPDGRWVVFSVTEPSYEEGGDVTDLWVVPADGSAEPRRLTSGEGGEGDPAWSPDSRRLAFTAERGDDEQQQVYVLDFAAGGEAVRLTDAPLGARGPRWSPDGRTILFQASVRPGAMDETSNRELAERWEERKSKVRIYESFPIRRWDRWLDDARTHLFTIAAAGDGEARDLLAGTELAAADGFRGRNSRSGDDLDAVWAPDGESILIVATTAGHTAARRRVSTHLYRVPVAGGEPVQLTSGPTSFTSPVFRADGEGVCFSLHDDAPEVFFAHDDLACAGWPWDGEIRNLTEGFDRSVGDFALAPDGVAYFTAFDGGRVKLHAVPTTGGEVEPAVEGDGGAYGGVAVAAGAKGTVLVATWQSAVQPTEIVRIDGDRSRTFLTAFNTEAAAGLDWQPLREFWFTNGKGRESHAFVALPPGFDESRKYPVLVLIHGGHASMWRDAISLRWNYHLLASPGFVLVAPEYRGSVGHGLDFTLDIQADPLRGPAEDIALGLEEALGRFPFLDGDRVAAAGASYGGHLVNWLEATTDRYRCLVSHAGLASLDMQWSTSDVIYHRELMMGGPFWERPGAWLDQSPLARAGDFKTPMLMSIGETDYRVPLNNTIAMWSALMRMNVPARLLVWPDENHWVMKGENSKVFYREVANWLGGCLRTAGRQDSTP
jgi:dipeptidyl aminopeptidase/acylaminoacyl peptidase